MIAASLRSTTPHPPLPPRSRERYAPALAVHTAHGERMRTRDGRELWLRDIEPGDVAALRRCFTRLSPEDIRRRFLHAMSELPMPMAQRLCNIDPALDGAALRRLWNGADSMMPVSSVENLPLSASSDSTIRSTVSTS